MLQEKLANMAFFEVGKFYMAKCPNLHFSSDLDAQYSKIPLLFNNKYLLSVPYGISWFLFCDMIITLRTIFFCTIFKGSPVHLFLLLRVTLLVLLFFFDIIILGFVFILFFFIRFSCFNNLGISNMNINDRVDLSVFYTCWCICQNLVIVNNLLSLWRMLWRACFSIWTDFMLVSRLSKTSSSIM